MRIGIIALLHESNTFVRQPTTMKEFREDLLMEGDAIRDSLAASHHEIGGFFAGIDEYFPEATAVPLVAARATPSGVISSATFDQLVDMILSRVDSAGRLDGILVAPHGAAVCESHTDADGWWLEQLRNTVGPDIPIIGTLDAHANLSRQMVDNCNALVAYRTNPHLDQRDRGREASRMMIRTLRGEIRPTMAAVYPRMAINIERQCTAEPHLQPLYHLADRQLETNRVLSNSVLLGFPYADVYEMGAATIAVTDNDMALAQQMADQLANCMWTSRAEMRGRLISVESALNECEAEITQRICLLDMGDNVGGGSAADGTTLVHELVRRSIGPAFACLFDPESVDACANAQVGANVKLRVGGKTDRQHGESIHCDAKVISLHDGQFREDQPRHGGAIEFDQGTTAIVTISNGLTLMLTSRRMVPFSLKQLTSFGVDPTQFRVLIAKGVNAPIAAYRDVCPRFIRVNTIGSTCADLTGLEFQNRRRPLYPFETATVFDGV